MMLFPVDFNIFIQHREMKEDICSPTFPLLTPFLSALLANLFSLNPVLQ